MCAAGGRLAPVASAGRAHRPTGSASYVASTREDGPALRADPNPGHAGRGAPTGAAARPPQPGHSVRDPQR